MNPETLARIVNNLKDAPNLPPDVTDTLNTLAPLFVQILADSAADNIEKHRRMLLEEASLRIFLARVQNWEPPRLRSEDATVRQLAAQEIAETANELALQWLLAFEAFELPAKGGA